MPAPLVKRNTVDVITSKTSYETVIPVHILPSGDEYTTFVQRCKPFDIIDGRNPFDEPSVAPPGVPEDTTTSPSGRRRPRSMSPNAAPTAGTRRGGAKKELATHARRPHDSEGFAGPREGWAAATLADTTPYALSTPRDDYSRVGYVLDSADYAWCREEGVAPAAVQHGVTFLEWRYVQHILQRATSAAEMARGSAERQTQSRRSARGGGGGSGSGGDNDADRCAVCARTVEFAQSFDEDSVSVLPGVNNLVGLRCQECGTPAHLQCWFLSEMPRASGAWVCDACSAATRGGRKRQHQRCIICSRTGGVLIAYKGHQGGAGGSSSSTHCGSPSSPLGSTTLTGDQRVPQPSAFTVATPAALHGTGNDPLCHVVCALAFPELTVEAPPTQVRRNGLVDMTCRPYVHALRRIPKQRYPMNCGYCNQEGGICLTCHHPRCFESMHPACAAEAHAVECFEAPAPSDQANTSVAFLSTAATPVSASSVAASSPLAPSHLPPQQCWSQCHVYCLKHFGVSLSYSLGSSALGQEAEAEALAADLTGVLTTKQEQFATGSTEYPEAQKRGRGRPPVALVRRREEEQGLIGKVKAYWISRRQARRRESAQLVPAINTAMTASILAAAFRPELIKIAPTKVRLSHFMCLVPEWQQYLVMNVEGELPLPDEEYEDAQRYRKNHAPHTRRSGNTVELFDKLKLVNDNAEMFCALSQYVVEGCELRKKEVDLITQTLDLSCQWDA